MKPQFFCLSLILLVVVLVSSSPVSAGLDRHLPPDTIAFTSWAGRGMVFDGSMFGQTIQAPDVKEILKIIREMIDNKISDSDENKKKFAIAWEMGAIAWECPAAVGVIGGKDIGVILLVDLGKNKPAFKKQLDEILAADGKNPAVVTVGAYQYQSLPDTDFIGEISYGFKGEVFFVTFGGGKNQAKALLQRDAAKSLAANKKYQECTKAVGGKNEQISFYVNAGGIAGLAEAKFGKPAAPNTPSQFRTIINALGVGKLNTIAGSVRIVDKGMYTKIKLFTPAPHQGLLMPLTGRGLVEKDISALPNDTDFALVVNISAEKLYAEIRRVVTEINPQTDTTLQATIAGMEETIGVSLVDGVLKCLGDTWIISSAASQGGPLAGTVISADVKDSETLRKSLLAIEIFAGNMLNANATDSPACIRKQKIGGIEISYLHAPDLQFVLPAWAIHKNRLYLALWPQVIVSTIKNQTAPLGKFPEYKRIRGHLSPNASGLVYINTPQLTKTFYPVSLIFGTAVINQLSRQFPDVFPDKGPIPYWPLALSTLLKYSWPEADTISHDATGITFEAYGSSPVSAIAVPVVVGGTVAAVLPSLNRVKYVAMQKKSSAANLPEIEKATEPRKESDNTPEPGVQPKSNPQKN